jgi:hypothetical protein
MKDEKEKPSEYQGLPVRRSLKNYGNLKENLTPEDFDALEKQARETFAKAEAETVPSGRTAAGKANRLKVAREYQRKARRNRTPEQKRRQVQWTKNWRHKCRQTG